MKRLIFLNRYFHPDRSATSQILSDLAFHLARQGHEVYVITSRLRYDAAERLPPFEKIHGVSVHRVASTQLGRSSVIGRATDYLTFCAAAWRTLRALTRAGDVIVAKTDPPLLSALALPIARRKKAHLVNWLQDIYPEIAVRLGVRMLVPAGWLTKLRDWTLRGADFSVVPGEAMARLVRTRGAHAERVHVIHNWTDDTGIVPVAHAGNSLRLALRLHDKFVVGYSGNLGRAHDMDTLLQAAEEFRDNDAIVFAVTGGGYNFEKLKQRVEEKGLSRGFRFFPYQPQDKLGLSLAAADVHWLSLKPGMEDVLFPSKFYAAAAAGRPIIAVTAEDADTARLVETHRCGFAVAPGDGKGFAAAIRALAGDPALCRDMGARARAMLDGQFSRSAALNAWQALLARLTRVP